MNAYDLIVLLLAIFAAYRGYRIGLVGRLPLARLLTRALGRVPVVGRANCVCAGLRPGCARGASPARITHEA